MRETSPKVYLIAKPRIDWNEIQRYLESIDGEEWLDHQCIESTQYSGESLIEFMGRLCYRSWIPGLNPNVTKVRKDRSEYLRNLLSSGHGSVLEHASYSFVFQDVSRVFTHELVRHRVGVAISQESLRYVRLTDIGFRIPKILEPLRDRIVTLIDEMERFQRDAADGIDVKPFSEKKKITSAIRRLAPLGLSTTIGWTANIRTLRFVIEKRTELAAEEEMRIVFDQVASIMSKEEPHLFGDLTPTHEEDDAPATWTTEFSKV